MLRQGESYLFGPDWDWSRFHTWIRIVLQDHAPDIWRTMGQPSVASQLHDLPTGPS